MRRLIVAILAAGAAASLSSVALAVDASSQAAGLVVPKHGVKDHQLTCETCLKPITSGAGYKNGAGAKKQPGSAKAR